jgi:hypothetical protein
MCRAMVIYIVQMDTYVLALKNIKKKVCTINQFCGMRIRDVYPGSDFFPSRIPNPERI